MAPLGVALGHLLVDDAAAGGHPLHVARRDHAAVAEAVAVLDVAAQHVGDGLDPAVGMPGEALQVLLGLVGAEVVEQQERVVRSGGPKPMARWRWTPAPSMVGRLLTTLRISSVLGHGALLGNCVPGCVLLACVARRDHPRVAPAGRVIWVSPRMPGAGTSNGLSGPRPRTWRTLPRGSQRRNSSSAFSNAGNASTCGTWPTPGISASSAPGGLLLGALPQAGQETSVLLVLGLPLPAVVRGALVLPDLPQGVCSSSCRNQSSTLRSGISAA